MDLTDKYLITEKKNILKTMSFWKNVLFAIQDINDLKSSRLSPDEKTAIINKNIGLVNQLLKKHNVEPLYRDIVIAGMQIALKHSGQRMKTAQIR